MEEIYNIFLKSIMISGFVFIMMVLIEYINVQTKGVWQKYFTGNKWNQYLIAGLLGALPGCLGAFTTIALFSHRLISFGAVVTTMIATSGDEAFIMFSMFPKQAIILTSILLITGILAGYITDKFYHPKDIFGKDSAHSLPLHEKEQCICFQKKIIISNLLQPSLHRLSLAIGIIAIIIGLITDVIAGHAEMWIKATLMFAFSFALFIVITVPDHFMKEHIWNHIVKVHLPRIFLWVFGISLLIYFVAFYINV